MKKFRKRLIKVCITFLILFILVIGGAYIYAKVMPKLEINVANSLVFYDQNNEVFFQGNEKTEWVGLNDISKNVISTYSKERVYENSLNWAKRYDKELEEMLQDKEYALKVFGIERGTAKPRKDISKWAEIKNAIYYMYDEKFFSLDNNFEYAKINDKEEIKKILSLYLEKYFNINDDKQTWFDKIKDLSEELGYAREVKMFKQEPEKWKAHVGDVSTVLRVSLTGRQQTPDLYEIMQVLGKESVEKRFKNIIEK